jgi:ABC-type multidrug transport system fused ATPase/permease subunit
METLDTSLSNSIRATSSQTANFIAAMVTVAIVVPPFLVPAILIGYFYYKLSLGYIRAGRELRRLESNTRSPIFSSFGELLQGIVTVRAFSAEQRFFSDIGEKIDLTTQFWYSFWWVRRHVPHCALL